MIVVIQCAASKHDGAGSFTREDGRKVVFVANPAIAPPSDVVAYAKPDDVGHDGETWRDKLLRYNASGANPLGLCRARELYRNAAYRRLAHRFGAAKLFVLSAGWGLVGRDFLLPYYDITFSQSAKRTDTYKYRRGGDVFRDFCHLPLESAEPVVFVGGKDYVPLFCTLTKAYRGPRSIFYNASIPPNAPGCRYRRYETTTRTNWHYECANALVEGRLDLS